MINTLRIFEELQQVLEPPAARKITEIIGTVFEELRNTLTKAEFNELKEIVRDLAEAQKRTEQKIEELAEAQKRTELRVEELAEAQKKTEKALQQLIKDHQDTRKQVGGLSITVGYTLENEAFKALPGLLERDHGLLIQGRLKRQYITDKEGLPLEVNIFGKAKRGERELTILGEGKSQLSQNAIDTFLRKKLNRLTSLYDEIFPIFVTHMITSPSVEEYARKKGIALYYSYDF